MRRDRRLSMVMIFLAMSLILSRPAMAQIVANERVRNYPAAYCTSVLQPDLISVEGIGTVRLLGVHAPTVSDFGYEKALAATRKFVEGQNVRVEICPVRRLDEENHVRAVVYYTEGGNWFNLNTKLLRAGLASAQAEQQCHLHTAAWAGFVRDAEAKKRGIFHLGGQIPHLYNPQQAGQLDVTARKGEASSGEAAAILARAKLPRADLGEVPVRYVGSIQSKRFHRLGCIVGPAELDRVFFPTRLQAIKEGFKPCVVCRP